jgi:uncharacterized membrane protein
MMQFLFYHTPLFYLIQSLWRDEAFSYFMAKPGVFQIIVNTAADFNPPLYYILLHFWVLLFGKSDELLRILSFIFHLGSVYISYLLAKKIFSEKFAYFVAAFTFLNPMLLYYGFEMRMYSLYALTTFASIYFLYTRQWKKYWISTIAGLYTHSFFPLIIFSYMLIYRFIPRMKKGDIIKVGIPSIFFIPWLFVLVNQFLRSKESWLYPVDLQLIKSVLGNLFTSYEGTPGGIWSGTAILSATILGFLVFLFLRQKKHALIFLTPLFVPLSIILGYSIIKRPLFVNRYLIFVTVFEVLGIVHAIYLIKNKMIRYSISLGWLVALVAINIWISPYKKKTDFKTTFAEINAKARSSDFAYAKTPIGFLETAYYFKNTDKVFVYNPDTITIPNYIGSNLLFPKSSQQFYPKPPSVTYLIDDDAHYELVIRQ